MAKTHKTNPVTLHKVSEVTFDSDRKQSDSETTWRVVSVTYGVGDHPKNAYSEYTNHVAINIQFVGILYNLRQCYL